MPLTAPNTIASWVYAIHHTLEHEGIDSTPILAAHGIQLSELSGTQHPIPKEQVNKLWKAAIAVSRNDALALNAIEYVQDSSFNALLTSIKACRNIQQALTLLKRHYALISTATTINISIVSDIQIEVTNTPGYPPLTNEDVDITFGLISKSALTLTLEELKPCRITMNRPTPKSLDTYHAFYGCPVSFNEQRNLLTYPIEALSKAILGANPSLSAVTEEFLLNKYNKTTKLSVEQQVHTCLLTLLPDSTPKIGDVAIALNMSKRSLQRKLSEENLNFKGILSQLRLEQAKNYLLQDVLSIKEIAYRLGFSESCNFIRFFKQNSGKTPSEYSHHESSVARNE